MRDNDEIDSVLDAALASYSDREPAPGFAERILANIPALPPRRPGWESGWKPWAIAVPAAAAAVLLLLLIPVRHASRKAAPTTTAGNSLSRQPSRIATPLHIAQLQRPGSRARVHSRHLPIPASLPKQEVFPTPQPLTAEEQALVSLAQRSPGDTVQALSENQKPPVEPLKIAGIHIPPLVPPDQGGN